MTGKSIDCGSVARRVCEVIDRIDREGGHGWGSMCEAAIEEIRDIVGDDPAAYDMESGSHADRIAEIKAESEAKHEAAMRELEDIRRNRTALRDTECTSVADVAGLLDRLRAGGVDDETSRRMYIAALVLRGHLEPNPEALARNTEGT